MLRKLLDIRAMLIVLAVVIGLALVAIHDLYAGSVVVLEMPHIEGGTEVTMHNIMHDAREKNDGRFTLPPADPKPEPEPEPERNEFGVREDWIARGPRWLR